MLNSSITRISSTKTLPNTIVQCLRQLNMYSKKKPQNLLIASSTTRTQKRNAAHFKFVPEVSPASLGEVTKMNLCQAVTNALDISLSADKTAGKNFQKKVFFL